jgi:hypothetical protein
VFIVSAESARDAMTKASSKVTRREFGRKAAAAFAVASVGAPAILAEAAHGAATLEAAHNVAAAAVCECSESNAVLLQDGQQAPELPTEVKAEVDWKVQNVIARWGDRLNDDQKTRMRTIITRHVQMLQSVRKFDITNADAPATVLKLVDGRGGMAAVQKKGAAAMAAKKG